MKREKIQVDCPSVVQKYNKYMGGVDRFDENVHYMRVGLRGIERWYPLFAFGLDFENKLTYCEFRKNIVSMRLLPVRTNLVVFH